jgi:hypothetical protein
MVQQWNNSRRRMDVREKRGNSQNSNRQSFQIRTLRRVSFVNSPAPWAILHNLLLHRNTESSFTRESISWLQADHHLLTHTSRPVLENTFCLITSRPITSASEDRSWYIIFEHINLKWPDSHVRMRVTKAITATLFERSDWNGGWSPVIAGSDRWQQTWG